MKRWFVLVLLVTGSLGGPISAAPASATVITHVDRDVASGSVTNGRIAYVTDSRRCDDCHVFTIESDGSDRVRLTDLGAGGPEWSPDGTQLIFPALAADGRVATATIAADGTGFEIFEIPDPTLNVACWSWSPDGTRLVCESWDDTQPDRGGIYTVSSTDGQDLERLTANPYGGGDFPGDFSPDGSRYVFPRENPQRRNGTLALFVVNADGTDVTRLTPWRMPACCGGVSWSPDGERILFDAGGTFYTMHPDGTEITPIELRTGAGFAFPFDPSWSPDGMRFVFSMYRRRTNQVDIFTAAADGSDRRQITDTRREDGFADWGPA
jgi:Tol biopolymer transport system component